MATRYYGTATAYSVAHAVFSQELELSTSAPGTGSSSEDVRKSSSEDTHLWTGPLAGTGVTAYLDDADQSLDLSAFPSGLALTTGVTAEDTSTSIVTDGGVSDVDSVTMGAWSSTTGTGIKTRTYSSGSFDAGTFATSDEVSWGISATNSDNKNTLTVTVDFSSNDTWVEITPDVSVTATGTPEFQPLTMSGVGAMQQFASATGTLNLAGASIVGVAERGVSAYTTLVQSYSPQLHYPCDDPSGATSLREGGGGTAGTESGTDFDYAQTGPTINGEAQTAVRINGNSGWNLAAPSNTQGGELTVIAWVKSPGTGANDFLGQRSTEFVWQFYANSTTLQFYGDLDGVTDWDHNVNSAAGEAIDDTWHFIAAGVDATGDLWLRVDDGTRVNEGTGRSYNLDGSALFHLRGVYDIVDASVYVSQVAYFDTSLSDAQLDELFAGSAGQSATGTATLSAATVSGTASSQQQADATGAIDLTAITVAGVAAQANQATGSVVLGAAEVTGTASQTNAATGAALLAAATVAGTAAQTNSATGTITTQSVTTAGVGDYTAPPASATGAVVLSAATVAGTAAQANDATGAVALPAATVNATAAQTNAATGAIDFEPVTVSGVADQTYSATGAITGQPVVIDGTGEALQPLEATGAVDLASISVVGAASVAHDATGAIVTGAVTVNGAAFQALGAAASGAILGAAVTVSGTAAQGYDASGTVDSEPVTVNATAAQTNAATGQSVIPATEVTGAAVQANVTTGVIALAGVTMDGSAALAVSGAGDIDLAGVTVDGTGDAVVALTGTGTITLPVVDVDGVGATPVATVPGGRRRRQQQVEPTPPALVATGSVSLGAMRMTGTATSRDDDIWLYLDPALYLAGVR